LERIWGAIPAGRPAPAEPPAEPQPPAESVAASAEPATPAQEPAWLPALHDLVYELLETEEIADPVSERLERAPDLLLSDAGELPEPTDAALEAAAAVGYMARRAETECFPDVGSARGLSAAGNGTGPVDQAITAADLAVRERIDPEPTDEFRPSWLVPGVLPDERVRLRERTLSLVARTGADGALVGPQGPITATEDDLRRAWKFGYFLRCLAEPPQAGSSAER
jgi:hypothetical protein